MASRGFYYWFSGLTDGEGCFLIHARKDKTYQCVFRISMRDDDSSMLNTIVKELGFGYYKKQQRASWYNGGHWHKPTSAFVVSSLKDCAKLIEVFDKYPLRSKKARDYRIWREAVIFANSVYGVNNADRSLLEKLSSEIISIREYREA